GPCRHSRRRVCSWHCVRSSAPADHPRFSALDPKPSAPRAAGLRSKLKEEESAAGGSGGHLRRRPAVRGAAPRPRCTPKNGSILRGRKARIAPQPASKKPAGPDRITPDSSRGTGSVPKAGCLGNASPVPRKPAGRLFEGTLEQLQDPPVLVVPRVRLLVGMALERVAGQLPLVLAQ